MRMAIGEGVELMAEDTTTTMSGHGQQLMAANDSTATQIMSTTATTTTTTTTTTIITTTTMASTAPSVTTLSTISPSLSSLSLSSSPPSSPATVPATVTTKTTIIPIKADMKSFAASPLHIGECHVVIDPADGPAGKPLPEYNIAAKLASTIITINSDQPMEGASLAQQDNVSIVPTAIAATRTPHFILDPDSAAEVDHRSTEHNNTVPVHYRTATSRQLFAEAAAVHGGDETTSFLMQEINSSAIQQHQHQQHQLQLQQQQQQQQHLRSLRNVALETATVSRNPSTSGGKHEKKIGHRRVDEGGEVTYKRIQSKQIMGAIQLGIQQTVGSLASKPKRDLLMNDFWEMETISFPPDGSSITPAHHYSEFRFKVYAPIAFRYFRDLFGIAPDDFLMSLCAAPLRQLSNPGASGSIFYLTDDDEFIIKTVQKKECEFLQKLLPGYYMNLSQNPRTLLPKFFGLYCFHYNSKNVRLVAMNNLLPSDIKMHAKYDLKGSTFRRKASKAERQKASPTFKDLDFMEDYPNGIFLETETYNALMKTIQRDCMVLESFQIMDYSLLVGIHNLDTAQKEKRDERIRNARLKLQRTEEVREIDEPPFLDQQHQHPQQQQQQQQQHYHHHHPHTPGQQQMPGSIAINTPASTSSAAAIQAAGSALNRSRSMNRRLVAHSTAMESITAHMTLPIDEDEDMPAGGIPARSENDERLILYIGVIDILQSYRLEKKLEHTFKSIIYNGDTVSVCRPSFYAQRFQNFMGKTVFKKTPTFPLKHSPSKRKPSVITMLRTPQRVGMQMANIGGGGGGGGGGGVGGTPGTGVGGSGSGLTTQRMLNAMMSNVMSGSSTPPPAFDDISEEDVTATSSTAGLSRQSLNSRRLTSQYNRMNSNRRSFSSGIEDYSDDDTMSSVFQGNLYTHYATLDLSQTNLEQQQHQQHQHQQQQQQQQQQQEEPDDQKHPNQPGKGPEPEQYVDNKRNIDDADDVDSNEKNGGLDSDYPEDEKLLHAGEYAGEQAFDGSDRTDVISVDTGGADVNGKPIISTTRTTVIKSPRTQSQTYTTTLVVNDVIR